MVEAPDRGGGEHGRRVDRLDARPRRRQLHREGDHGPASSSSGPSPRRGRRSGAIGTARRTSSPAPSAPRGQLVRPQHGEAAGRVTGERDDVAGAGGRQVGGRPGRVEHRAAGGRAVQVRVDRALHAEAGQVGRDDDGAGAGRGRRRTTPRGPSGTARSPGATPTAPCTHTTTGRGVGARPAGIADGHRRGDRPTGGVERAVAHPPADADVVDRQPLGAEHLAALVRDRGRRRRRSRCGRARRRRRAGRAARTDAEQRAGPSAWTSAKRRVRPSRPSGMRAGVEAVAPVDRSPSRPRWPSSSLPWLPEGRLVRVDGRGELFARIHRHPDPDAPVVLLLHGWTASSDLQFVAAYEALAGALHVRRHRPPRPRARAAVARIRSRSRTPPTTPPRSCASSTSAR